MAYKLTPLHVTVTFFCRTAVLECFLDHGTPSCHVRPYGVLWLKHVVHALFILMVASCLEIYFVVCVLVCFLFYHNCSCSAMSFVTTPLVCFCILEFVFWMVWWGDAHGVVAYVLLYEEHTSGDSASLLIAGNIVVSFYVALNQSWLYWKLLEEKLFLL